MLRVLGAPLSPLSLGLGLCPNRRALFCLCALGSLEYADADECVFLVMRVDGRSVGLLRRRRDGLNRRRKVHPVQAKDTNKRMRKSLRLLGPLGLDDLPLPRCHLSLIADR
jgi:hypothetical protein